MRNGHEVARGKWKDKASSFIKGITIGSDCWLGSGVRVLMGVTIGNGAVVGAGSVVTKNIPPYEIWAGAPAKLLKKRE